MQSASPALPGPTHAMCLNHFFNRTHRCKYCWILATCTRTIFPRFKDKAVQPQEILSPLKELLGVPWNGNKLTDGVRAAELWSSQRDPFVEACAWLSGAFGQWSVPKSTCHLLLQSESHFSRLGRTL